jgi:replicative DNA helicase
LRGRAETREQEKAPIIEDEGGVGRAARVSGKVPPNDLAAEAAVLSAIILEPMRFADVAHYLKGEHFYSPANRLVYDAIVAIEGMGMAIDVTVIAHHLRAEDHIQKAGGARYLAKIIDATPAITNIETHARIVFELWRARQMIQETMKCCALGYSLGSHADRVPTYLEDSQAKIFAVGFDAQRSSISSASEGVLTLMDRMSHEGPDVDLHGLPTGFSDLDRVPVRFAKSNVTIIGARPGMGKTAFAVQLALNLSSANTEDIGSDRPSAVGFFSLEQPTDQLILRAVCQIGGANLSNLVSGNHSETDHNKVISGAETLEQLPIWFDDTAGITLPALRAKTRLICQKADINGAKLRVIIIDYVQLMTGRSGKDMNREQQLSEISRGIKALAKDMRIHVIVLCQLNREVERRNPPVPLLSDLRESGSFEQDADTILLLYRPEYYAQKRESFKFDERDKGACQVIVGKNRHGPEGAKRLAWIASCTRFAGLAQQDFDEVS